MADGPQTSVTTTTRDPNSKAACGCTRTSYILVRAESPDSPVVRKNYTTYAGPTMFETSGLVSQEACEATLLTTSAAVAYSYNVLTQSCVLYTQITDSVSAPDIRSGVKVQEFPWQCHLACIAYADPRWTGVIEIRPAPLFTPTCQCCFNEEVLPRFGERVYYGCSASGCGDSWCASGSSNSASKTMRWLVLATFLWTFVERRSIH